MKTRRRRAGIIAIPSKTWTSGYFSFSFFLSFFWAYLAADLTLRLTAYNNTLTGGYRT